MSGAETVRVHIPTALDDSFGYVVPAVTVTTAKPMLREAVRKAMPDLTKEGAAKVADDIWRALVDL